MGFRTNLTGQQFGTLEVLGYDEEKHEWQVKCACGNQKTVKTGNLKSAKSCGCLQGYKDPSTRRKREVPDQVAALRYLFKEYRSRAKRFQIEFTLTEAEFSQLVQNPCHYCGSFPSNSQSITRKKTGLKENLAYSGLDRCDPQAGYTTSNVLPACWPCNRAKGKMTGQEFLEFLRRIFFHRKEQFCEYTLAASG